MPSIKKLTLTLIPLVLLTLSSISQDSTTCLPNSQLRSAIKLIQRGKDDSAKVVLLNRNIELLVARLNDRDNEVADYEKREATFGTLVGKYEEQIGNLKQGQSILNDRINQLNKSLQKKETKAWLVGGAGLAAVILTAYITSR